jgi:hypothetical protein
VRARIHRGAQASVTYLELTPLPAAAVTAISTLIPTDTVELGDTAHAAITAAGIALGPHLRSTDCSCSARTPRCVHVLATYYTLARQVDESPWLALDLQGYRNTTPPAGTDRTTPRPRWTPLDTLDPATYFGTLTT